VLAKNYYFVSKLLPQETDPDLLTNRGGPLPQVVVAQVVPIYYAVIVSSQTNFKPLPNPQLICTRRPK
jgi:hypothetical protein